MTPGSTTRPNLPSSRPSTADGFQKLFPSSPLVNREATVLDTTDVPAQSLIEIEDTREPIATEKANLEEENPEHHDDEEISAELIRAKETEDDVDELRIEDHDEESVETPVEDVYTIMEKVALYARNIYSNARREDGTRSVRKYSRKLKRLTEKYQSQQQKPLS